MSNKKINCIHERIVSMKYLFFIIIFLYESLAFSFAVKSEDENKNKSQTEKNLCSPSKFLNILLLNTEKTGLIAVNKEHIDALAFYANTETCRKNNDECKELGFLGNKRRWIPLNGKPTKRPEETEIRISPNMMGYYSPPSISCQNKIGVHSFFENEKAMCTFFENGVFSCSSLIEEPSESKSKKSLAQRNAECFKYCKCNVKTLMPAEIRWTQDYCEYTISVEGLEKEKLIELINLLEDKK